ncbi:hypothetical protein [Bdellovibrio bacteriovorus]|uniref:Uncharacterized protein n=1 Tax=Bdellovibrio bacteriovorus str. Tiberius TaxID=1069642 RepID=K7YW57_BDEBC|nr:hypothetical protein [Bdellovibrio bacteriovorus]AFY01898.1 hypothetical protein Bdt_2213 [Bdellovibrio bacteriovorus str. Tiberius]
MTKLVFLTLILISTAAFGKSEKATFSDLRPRLLLKATADLSEVVTQPEILQPPAEKTVNMALTEYDQKPIRKDRLYRVSYVHSFNSYGLKDHKKVDTVYTLSLVELGKNLQPTGVIHFVGTKADPESVIGNFEKIPDQLYRSPTLQTGRAAVRDHVINSASVILNGKTIAAYNKFEVVAISKEYIPFTLAFKYTLKLREVRTKHVYTLSAPERQKLPLWAHLVAPGNERVIKFPGGELHY